MFEYKVDTLNILSLQRYFAYRYKRARRQTRGAETLPAPVVAQNGNSDQKIEPVQQRNS